MGYPQNGDRVVKVNSVIDIKWNSHDIGKVDIFLTDSNVGEPGKNGVKQIMLAEDVTSETGITNSWPWSVTDKLYNDYGNMELYLAISMKNQTNIIDYSKSFYIVDNDYPDVKNPG